MSDDNRKQNHGRGFGRRAFLQAAAATAGVLAARPAFGTAEVPQERSGEGPYSGDEPSGAHRYLRDAEKFDETAPQPNHTYDAIVVGGGVSGVAAAYRLRDTDFLLIEKDRFLGGASKMETWEGIDYPIGPDFMTAPEKGTELAKFYAELGIDKLWRATSVQEEALFTPAGIVRDFWSSTPQLRRARDFLADLGKNRCPTVRQEARFPVRGRRRHRSLQPGRLRRDTQGVVCLGRSLLFRG
ncbi:MAG: FAD-dependent oxidoreductase [Candidatus Wallbacteria bacterium]|nr:FAD-dependent oxidoreductase [Candidatus Wallbacteria bacterium]